MNRIHSLTCMFLFIFLALLSISGCSLGETEKTKEESVLYWPPAPDQPRIRFLKSVNVPLDLKIHRDGLNRFWDYLTGNIQPSIVRPYGLETDAMERLYVVDTELGKVHIFDPSGNSYHIFPNGESDLVSPIDIAIDNDRQLLYISDSEEKVVKVYSDLGKQLVDEIGKGFFRRPTGLAVNPISAELLVVDTLDNTIFRFSLAARKFLGIWGGRGKDPGQLSNPTNIFVTSTGDLLISDSLNFRIQVFSATGKFKRTIGSQGETPGYFTRPRGVAADSFGNIYVVDALFDNIQIFNKSGELLMAFGEHGTRHGEFWLPTGIYIDSKNTIYISDAFNSRVQIFELLRADANE